MGLPDMETRFLSGETNAEKISKLLRVETECRRGQLHFSSTGERNNHPELDRRYARTFSFHHQGAPGTHAHQAPEDRGRISAAFSLHSGRIGACRAAWPSAVPTSAQLQSRSGCALRVLEMHPANRSRGF